MGGDLVRVSQKNKADGYTQTHKNMHAQPHVAHECTKFNGVEQFCERR